MNTRLIQQLAPYVSTYDSLKKANSKDSKKSVNAAQLTTSQQQTIADAMQLWSEYKDSPEGQAFLESLKSMDLDEIYDSLQQLSLGPVMTAIKDLVGAALDYSIIPNSFSIGLNFQIELIIGLDITIGVAFGIGDSEGLSSSEWLSIGLTEGVDEGGELDLQFGLWESAPSDLGGF